jgi:ADP-heptose:LPS heptosyltransferase
MNDIFLPWRNEFGTLVSYYCRFINAYKSDHKIACIKKGHESLYPSVKEFFYDWEDIKDSDKRGLKSFRGAGHHDFMSELSDELTYEFGKSTIHMPHLKKRTPVVKQPGWKFDIKPQKTFGISCDIAIAPRFRDYASGKNWAHWPELAEKLSDAGYSVASLGVKDFSADCPSVDIRSWDYPGGLDSDIELLQNCKLLICTDAGIAHLGALAGAPMTVIYDQDGILPGYNRRIRWMFHIIKGYSDAYCEPVINAWNDTDRIFDAVVTYLNKN